MGRLPKDKVLQEIKVSSPAVLLDFLIDKQVRKSRNAIKSLLSHKQIKVNGKLVTQFDHELKPGDWVAVMKFDQSRKEKKLTGLKIIFEDDDLIVIDKEVGFLSVSTDKEKQRTVYGVLNEYVKRRNKNSRIFVLHRLDREISGLMIFAKSAELQEMFQRNWGLLVQKFVYTGVVEGKLRENKGTVVSWLTENKNFVMFASSTDNGGLEAITHYHAVKTIGRYTMVDFELETRRKNQLRVQMQSIGHPIVGDKKYGASNNPIKRIALHAKEIVLKHPTTGEILEFKTTLPKMMQQLVTTPVVKNEETNKTINNE